MRLPLLAIGLGALLACSISHPTPTARVKRGPASNAALKKILALPTDCSAEDEFLCTKGQALAVDASARMSLEFLGLRLVDSEVVNTELRERTVATRNGSESVERTPDEGITWFTTTIEVRRAILAEMGIDGYLVSLITVGDRQNVEAQRTVTVTVSILRAADSAVAWTSRCSVETGRFFTPDQAVDIAAKCALESAVLVSG